MNDNIFSLKELVKELQVLYVEDDVKLHNEVKTFLKKIFNHLDCAMDGEEGLCFYKKNSYDIVITDIQMPKLNGIELVKIIKSINKNQVIIITSAHNESYYLLELINLGVSRFLLKPLRFMDIIEMVSIIAKNLNDKKELERLQFKEIREGAMKDILNNIAHHWRQPLNAISLLAQNLELEYLEDEVDKEYVQEVTKKIVSQTQFLSKTINTFSKIFRESKEKKDFNLIEASKEALVILLDILSEQNINLKFTIVEDSKKINLNLNEEYTNEKYNVHSYYNEFIQILINIIDNAKDAILKSKNNKNFGAKIELLIEKIDNKFSIKIRDNGGGIPQDVKDKIFEPYFTTKEVGEGDGLNLYMSKDLIQKNLNGKIEVKNIENGSEFTIFIPSQL